MEVHNWATWSDSHLVSTTQRERILVSQAEQGFARMEITMTLVIPGISTLLSDLGYLVLANLITVEWHHRLIIALRVKISGCRSWVGCDLEVQYHDADSLNSSCGIQGPMDDHVVNVDNFWIQRSAMPLLSFLELSRSKNVFPELDQFSTEFSQSLLVGNLPGDVEPWRKRYLTFARTIENTRQVMMATNLNKTSISNLTPDLTWLSWRLSCVTAYLYY